MASTYGARTPIALVNKKIKASVCAAFNNKMLNDSVIPAQVKPALRIQCYGAAEPYSLVINPQVTRAPLEAVLQPDAIQPDPDAALPLTVALNSANLCFKQEPPDVNLWLKASLLILGYTTNHATFINLEQS